MTITNTLPIQLHDPQLLSQAAVRCIWASANDPPTTPRGPWWDAWDVDVQSCPAGWGPPNGVNTAVSWAKIGKIMVEYDLIHWNYWNYWNYWNWRYPILKRQCCNTIYIKCDPYHHCHHYYSFTMFYPRSLWWFSFGKPGVFCSNPPRPHPAIAATGLGASHVNPQQTAPSHVRP